MMATAAHLSDHVFPRLPVRQWVLAVPTRLRYFLQRDAVLQGTRLGPVPARLGATPARDLWAAIPPRLRFPTKQKHGE